MKQGLDNLKYEVTYATVDYTPLALTTLSEEAEKKLSVVIQKLEDIDTVMKIHINW